MTVVEVTALLGAIGAFFGALGAFLTPVGVIATAVGVILSLRRQKKIEAKVDAQGRVMQVVKEQNDGVISRLELSRDASRAETKVAEKAATTAEAATVAAQAAGVAGVAEANRTHEASSAAIEKGAKDAVEPIAEEAVAKGAKAAVAEMKRES